MDNGRGITLGKQGKTGAVEIVEVGTVETGNRYWHSLGCLWGFWHQTWQYCRMRKKRRGWSAMHHLDNDRPPLTLQVMSIVLNGSLTHHRQNDSALWTVLFLTMWMEIGYGGCQRLVNLVSFLHGFWSWCSWYTGTKGTAMNNLSKLDALRTRFIILCCLPQYGQTTKHHTQPRLPALVIRNMKNDM